MHILFIKFILFFYICKYSYTLNIHYVEYCSLICVIISPLYVYLSKVSLLYFCECAGQSFNVWKAKEEGQENK